MKLFEYRVAQILGDESKHQPIHARFHLDPVIQQISKIARLSTLEVRTLPSVPILDVKHVLFQEHLGGARDVKS